MWSNYDKDNSGGLDKDEAKKFLKTAVTVVNPNYWDQQMMQTVFNIIDSDHDGHLNK